MTEGSSLYYELITFLPDQLDQDQLDQDTNTISLEEKAKGMNINLIILFVICNTHARIILYIYLEILQMLNLASEFTHWIPHYFIAYSKGKRIELIF